MRRVLPPVPLFAAVLALAALAGCTTGTDDPKSRAARAKPSPTVDYAPWAAGRSNPVADKLYPAYGNASVDVLHYGLDLAWAPETKTLTGQATIRLRAVAALPAVTLDFSPAYTIDATAVDGVTVIGTVAENKLTVAVPVAAERSATLVVKYHGTPKTVPMPSQRGDSEPLGLTVTDDGSLWTMQEPYGASTWYPSNDIPSDKAMYDITVTVPAGWTGVASGTPRGREGNTFRYASADPVASYLTTLAVGRYQQETAVGPHNLPITYWYLPGRHDRLMAEVIRHSPEYLTWLEQKLGPYPFPSAGVVLVPSASGMETQETVTLGDSIVKPGASLDWVKVDLVHEYAHQWLGDTVTTTTWTDLWLNEGPTTYVQHLFEYERDGVPISEWERPARANDAKLRKALGPPGSPAADRFAEGNVYHCPALMLHQIRGQVGDDVFFAMLRDWPQQHRGTNQDRAAFTAYVNRRAGRDLSPLINSWLDSPTTPQ